MNSKIRHIISILPVIIALLFMSENLIFADTVKLVDGTVLVGKIVKTQKGELIFSNAYGTFTIQAKDITQQYATKNYDEDIQIHRQLGEKINNAAIIQIKKNYIAGVKNKEKIEKENEPKKKKKKKKKKYGGNLWVSGRLSLSGSFYYTIGDINEVLPLGFSGNFALDQGLDMAIKKRHPMMPGIRFEFGYLHLEQGTAKISGYMAFTGLIWAFPSMNNSWGNIVLALMPGMSFIDIERVNSNYSVTSNTFSSQIILGYQYSFGVVVLFIHSKYLYIYDKDVLFHSIGFEAGVGFNAW